MWKWYSGEEAAPGQGAQGSQGGINNQSVTDLAEQLAQTEQLVVQLKELIRVKDIELRSKDQQLKEEKEACEAKLTKVKLQSKAKVTSLTAQLEEVKKQRSTSGSKGTATDQKKASGDGDQEHATASRGKIVLLRKKVEELESQVSQKDAQLQHKISELEAQLQRGSEMDAMLTEKDRKLAEKEAYIIELQLATVSDSYVRQAASPAGDFKDQFSEKNATQQDMQTLIQNFTRKVGESDERCSLLQEQADGLKKQLAKEKEQFQDREAMYMENIRVFQDIIQKKEKELMEQAQKHEQELFRLAAKSDASADLEQLLKALKQKLHEKEEVLQARTQVVDMMQKELDGRDLQIKEVTERWKRVQLEKEDLQSKLDAEKHVMRAQIRDLMEKHSMELKTIAEKHNTELQGMREKHETELSEKEQAVLQLMQQLQGLRNSGDAKEPEACSPVDSTAKQRMEELEAQVKLKTVEANKSEAKFLKIKAWSKSRIKQLEDELKTVQLSPINSELESLRNHISELEKEKEEMQQKLEEFPQVKSQNQALLAKLEIYEEQQRKLQADLEQVTKRAASQTSDSGSVEELQNQLFEWQEMSPDAEIAQNQMREHKSSMALRREQIEEEREAIVSGQQELEEELAAVRGTKQQTRRKRTRIVRQFEEGEYEFDGRQNYADSSNMMESTDSGEGENMGGLRTVVEELELERNRLQEQILALEEHCQDLEDRLQLQARIESLQSENERLQTQLAQLRSQQSRESEKHQQLVISLNEQLRGISEKKDLLQTSLVEKEQSLSEACDKLEQIEKLKELLHEKELLNHELGEKLLQSDLKMDEATKKCIAYEGECAALKVTVLDLTEKVTAFKEKAMKQEVAVEVLQKDLDQTNDELDRLNSSHLEERAQLIHDLQSREREIDSLKEIVVDKDKEIAALSTSMSEYSEQVVVLKQKIKQKEEEVGNIEEALSRAGREVQLLKGTQTSGTETMNTKISTLVEQLSEMELELNHAKDQREAKTKEVEELVKQIQENSETIQNLRSDVQKQNVIHKNHLVQCEAHITSLKEQISTATQKLQEIDTRNKLETEELRTQLKENTSAKYELNVLLMEKEEKVQSCEKELKSAKDLYNTLVAEMARKDEELVKLSKQVAEHTEQHEAVKMALQEKLEVVTLLEQRLQVVQQEADETKLNLVQELQAKDAECKKCKEQINEQIGSISKLENELHLLKMTNEQLQESLEEKEKHFAEQINLASELNIKFTEYSQARQMLESQTQNLTGEIENLRKQLNETENELVKQTHLVTELQNKIAASEEKLSEYQERNSETHKDNVELIAKAEQLSLMIKQKENSFVEQLLQKADECNNLNKELSEHKNTATQLREQLQSLNMQLEQLQQTHTEKSDLLNNKVAEYSTLLSHQNQQQEVVSLLQNQIDALKKELVEKERDLQGKVIECVTLQKREEQHQSSISSLQNEAQTLKDEHEKLSQYLHKKESALESSSAENNNLVRQIEQEREANTILSSQVEALSTEAERLKYEKEELYATLRKKTNECDGLQLQTVQYQSAAAVLQDQMLAVSSDNEKLKADIIEISAAMNRKSDEITSLQLHISQQAEIILSLKEEVSNTNLEKEKLNIILQEKEVAMHQQEALLKQLQVKTAENEHYMQQIAGLQNQVKDMSFETAQLKQILQEKENALEKQIQEIKLLRDKAEEAEILKVQLDVNMETISNLQNELQSMMKKSEDLHCYIGEKDALLKQKEDEYVNLKAKVSEMQDLNTQLKKQIEFLSSEADVLKAAVLEKDMAISSLKESISVCTEDLKLKLQGKEVECEALNQQITGLKEMTSDLQNEVKGHKSEISQIKEILSEKEASVVEQANLIKKLKDKASETEIYKSQFEDGTQMISQLQNQVCNMTASLKALEDLVQEKENAFSHLQGKYAAQAEELCDLRTTLAEKEELLLTVKCSCNEKDAKIQLIETSLSKEIAILRESLEANQLTLKNTAALLKQKDEALASHQHNLNSLMSELHLAKSEYQKAMDQINILNQNMQEKDTILQSLQEKCASHVQHIQNLKEDLENLNLKTSRDSQEKTLLIESLQQQLDSTVDDKMQLEKIIAEVRAEKEDLEATYKSQLQQKLEELQSVCRKVDGNMTDAEEQRNAVMKKMEHEKEQLVMQVSVKNEEIIGLKLEIQNIEQRLLESERKRLAEHDRESQQNRLLTEQLNSLGNELGSKDVKIHALQQDLDNLQERLTQNLSVLQETKGLLKEKDAAIAESVQQVTGMQNQLDKLVAVNLSRESEVTELRQLLSEKEKEVEDLRQAKLAGLQNISDVTQTMSEKLMCLEEEKRSLQNELKQSKTRQSEIESLRNEIAHLKEILSQQQIALSEKEKSLGEVNQEVIQLKQQLETLEEELQITREKLDSEVKTQVEHLQDYRKKEELVQNLTLQIDQQNNVVASLSLQLKEKDSSSTQVYESMSSEIAKISEEKAQLTSKIQVLESIRFSSMEEIQRLSLQLEECQKQLDKQQFLSNTKEIEYQEVINEKEQMQLQLEKLGKERDNLKKKLHAALMVRKDLMRKVEGLEKSSKVDIEKEQKNVEELLNQVHDLSLKLTSTETQVKEQESLIKLLKQQLLEKDNDINIINENLSQKESLLEVLQSDIRNINKSIIEKDAQYADLLQANKEKEILLIEKEKVFKEERTELIINLEKLKAELSRKEDLLPKSAETQLAVKSDNVTGKQTLEDPPVSILQTEKALLEKKLQAALLARKDTIRKMQEKSEKQKEEYGQLSASYSENVKALESIKDELVMLQQEYRTKCKLFEAKELDYCAALAEKEKMLDELKLQQESKTHEVLSSNKVIMSLEKKIDDLTCTVGAKDSQLEKLKYDFNQLSKEHQELQTIFENKTAQLAQNTHETTDLKHSIDILEQQYKQERITLLAEVEQLQDEMKKIHSDAESYKKALEHFHQEKETYTKTAECDVKVLKTECLKLKENLEQANIVVAKKDEYIQTLHFSLTELRSEFDQEKKSLIAEAIQLQNYCKEVQTQAKNFEIELKELRREKEDIDLSLQNSNKDILNLRIQIDDLCKEKDELLLQISCLQDEKMELGLSLEQIMASQKFEKEACDEKLSWQLERKRLLDDIKERDHTIQLLRDDVSERNKHTEALELQNRHQSKLLQEQENRMRVEIHELQKKTAEHTEENKSKEQLQRKLQAALISRKEALKENKALKETNEILLAEKEDILRRISTLEKSLADLNRQKENSGVVISSLSEEKEKLISEADKLLTENQNLAVACESLKSTMETITQEKKYFSLQMNSLKDSQAVELSEWKARHNELKQEYESLLQAYENMSGEIDKTRHNVEMMRKEKHEMLGRLHAIESEKVNFEKHAQEISEENEKLKDRMRKFAKSKQQKMQELEEEIQKLNSEVLAAAEKEQPHIHKLSLQNSCLLEENKELKETCDKLKEIVQSIQNENELSLNEVNLTKSAMEDLQIKNDSYQSDMQSRINEALSMNKSLAEEIQLLKKDILTKCETITVLEQEKLVLFGKQKQMGESMEQQNNTVSKLQNEIRSLKQESLSLNEKVRILEDDKLLLQEELENIQEHYDKVKNEKEYLEMELLKNSKKTNQLTDALKTSQIQNKSLLTQMDAFKSDKYSLIQEKEEQQLKLIREFEDKLRSSQRGSVGTKNKTRELQDLLKEKQLEINQLQKACIRYQELILDLERSVKLSEASHGKIEKELICFKERCAKSDNDSSNLSMKLEEARKEIAKLTAEKQNSREEIQKQKKEINIQIREKEKDMELLLRQQKALHEEELAALQERLRTVERKRERAVAEIQKLQEDVSIKDLQNKKLQGELNNNLARLAAFTKSMSSLQEDRDRVIDETKKWEIRFRDTIQEKEDQLDAKNQTIVKLEENVSVKLTEVQDLQVKVSQLEQTINEIKSKYKNMEAQQRDELASHKEENKQLSSRLKEQEKSLTDQEKSLETLLKEKKSLSLQIADARLSVMQLGALEQKLAEKEHEIQQVLSSNEELSASLQKQVAITQQLKSMLSNKDSEISLLMSSKDGEIAGYLAQVQDQHRSQTDEFESQLKHLQMEKEQADKAQEELKTSLENLLRKADQAVQERDQMVTEMGAFKKSMTSLQNDRDRIMSQYKDLEQSYLHTLTHKDSSIQEIETECTKLKQEVRSLRNQMDDLHSENAMLKAQLIRYREDLNQVLSLKDHQLKELLKQQLDRIKNLEHEKSELEKLCKERQRIIEQQNENIKSLEVENGRVTAQIKDLEVVIATMNKENLEMSKTKIVFDLQQKLQTSVAEYQDLKKELDIQKKQTEELQNRVQEVQQMAERNVKEAEIKYSKDKLTFERDSGLMENETETAEERVAQLADNLMQTEQKLLEVQNQNKEISSQNESFGKAMAALQHDRDKLIEDFKVLQARYAAELKDERTRTYNLETELNSIKSEVSSLLNERSVLNEVLSAFKSNSTQSHLINQLENLQKILSKKDLEIARLSAECDNYSRQVTAFSKAMASLQDDRDRLLQELGSRRIHHEAKQGLASAAVDTDSVTKQISLSKLQNKEILVKGSPAFRAHEGREFLKTENRIQKLERESQEAKAVQEQMEHEVSSYQTELAELRTEKNLILAELRAIKEEYLMTIAEKDCQISELQKRQEMVDRESRNVSDIYQIKSLENAALVGSEAPGQMKRLLTERNHLHNEVQRCLHELQQRELRNQQLNSRVIQLAEENTVLSSQLKAVSQTLRDTQMHYSELQNHYYRLEREYQTMRASFQDVRHDDTRTEVPPGAPQERASIIVEIDNQELSELKMRLTETEQLYDSTQEELSQLTEALSEERIRRETAEEALGLAEQEIKRFDLGGIRSKPREFTIQLESEEEREALIVDPSEHVVVRKMKGGAHSLKRWLRGRSLYCSKLLTSRAKSRYLFLAYLLTLHIVVFMCLTGLF